MSLIRVCAITTDCYPDDPTVRRTAEAAASADCEYHVICSMRSGQPRYELFKGVHVHRIRITGGKGRPVGRISGLPFGKMLWLWTIFGMRALGKVARLHPKLKFDVIHVHNLPDFLVFAALVPKCLGARVILHVQDVTPELMSVKATGAFRRITVLLAKWQERISTAFADHVLTVGWPFEEPLLKRGVPPWKLSSVLNSADPNVFSPEKRTEPFLGEATPERPLVFMYHGTCAKRNGLDVAIRAFAKAHAVGPHMRLHLHGAGEAIPSLQELARTLGVADEVVFTGYSTLEEVADFVVRGDVGVIPYPSDGFMELVLPTKAYEFAWMRRPMIASNTLAIRAMFRPGSIRLCESSSVDSFAEAMIDLYRHPEKRAQLVAGAEQDYLKYRWELMAERYRNLLVSLVRGSRRPNLEDVAGDNDSTHRVLASRPEIKAAPERPGSYGDS
jgi:glycosyltransferase involved in cell wall biosynthesis